MNTPGSTQESVKLRLGTATPGGGFPVYGAAFIAAVQEADPGISIEPSNTKGSTENVPMLEAGGLDLALVQGEVAHEALTGVGRAPADLEHPRRDVLDARHVRGARGQPLSHHRRSQGQARGVRRARLGPRHPRPLRARRRSGWIKTATSRRSILERAGDGPAMVHGRSRGGAVGRRHRLAGLHRGGQGREGRPLHRARRRRDRAHPGQAHVPQAADGRRRHVPGPGRGRSTRSARGASSWRAPDLPTRPWPTDLPRPCTRAKPPSPPSCRRPPRPPPQHRNRRRRPAMLHPGVRRYLREAGLLK